MKYRIVKEYSNGFIKYRVEIFINTGIFFRHMEWSGEAGSSFLAICKTKKEAKQVIINHKREVINDAKPDEVIMECV